MILQIRREENVLVSEVSLHSEHAGVRGRIEVPVAHPVIRSTWNTKFHKIGKENISEESLYLF